MPHVANPGYVVFVPTVTIVCEKVLSLCVPCLGVPFLIQTQSVPLFHI